MATPWATVVVPVYNTSRWLPEAFASIDAQSCRDRLEVVVVDDGSTDNSGEVAQAYARRAPSVRYLRQDNAGLGAARNRGVEHATGRYLAFLDSDDLFTSRGLTALLELAEEHAAEVAVGDMEAFPPRPSPRWRREIVVGPRVLTSLADAPELVGNPSACNKVFRRDFVADSGVTFTEGTAFEDVLFTLPLMLRASAVALTPELVYRYRQRGDESSIMSTRGSPTKIFQHLDVVEGLTRELDGASDDVRAAVQRWVAYMQMHYAWRASGALDDGQLAEFTSRMSTLFEQIPPRIIAEHAAGPGAGLRAVGIYLRDPDQVRQPQAPGGLRAAGGRVYFDHPAFDRLTPLLLARPLEARFTSLRTAAGGLVLAGRLRAPGLAAVPGQTRDDLHLEVASMPRPVEVTRVEGDVLHWSCRLPARELAPGRHAVRLVVVSDGSGGSGREVAAVTASAADGGIRPATVGGHRFWLERAGRGGARIAVTAGSAAAVAHAPSWLSGALRSRAAAVARRARSVARRALRSH